MIASGGLGAIERAVGRFHPSAQPGIGGRNFGDADADRALQRRQARERQGIDPRADAFGDAARIGQRGR